MEKKEEKFYLKKKITVNFFRFKKQILSPQIKAIENFCTREKSGPRYIILELETIKCEEKSQKIERKKT